MGNHLRRSTDLPLILFEPAFGLRAPPPDERLGFVRSAFLFLATSFFFSFSLNRFATFLGTHFAVVRDPFFRPVPHAG